MIKFAFLIMSKYIFALLGGNIAVLPPLYCRTASRSKSQHDHDDDRKLSLRSEKMKTEQIWGAHSINLVGNKNRILKKTFV